MTADELNSLSEENMNRFTNAFAYELFCFDLETEDVSEFDLPVPTFISCGYYVYTNDDGNTVKYFFYDDGLSSYTNSMVVADTYTKEELAEKYPDKTILTWLSSTYPSKEVQTLFNDYLCENGYDFVVYFYPYTLETVLNYSFDGTG